MAGEIEHSALVPGIGIGRGIHVNYALEYANAADRIAGINELKSQVLSDAYLGKWARQYSDNSFWMLLQVTPVILWERIDGASKETSAEEDIYIDSVIGNDNTGDGSNTNPYATIGKALSSLEGIRIKHGTRILAAHDGGVSPTVYEDDKIAIDNSVFYGGFLSIIGVGTPIVDVTGIVLTSVTSLGSNVGLKWTVFGAGWSDNQFSGMFIRVDSGTGINTAVPILSNDSENLYTRIQYLHPGIGDNISIVRPSVTWKLNSLSVNTDNTSSRKVATGIFNMNIDLSDTDVWGNPRPFFYFRLEQGNQNLQIDFVRVILKDDGVDDVVLGSGIKLNSLYTLFADSEVQSKSQNGIVNMTPPLAVADVYPGIIITRENVTPISTYTAVDMYSTEVHALSCLTEVKFFCEGSHRFLAAGSIFVVCAKCTCNDFIVLNNFNYGIKVDRGSLIAENFYIMKGSNCILLNCLGSIVIKNGACDPSASGYALVSEGLNSVCNNSINASLIAASGAILFKAPNPDVVETWPTAGNVKTDNMGTYIVYPG